MGLGCKKSLRKSGRVAESKAGRVDVAWRRLAQGTVDIKLHDVLCGQGTAEDRRRGIFFATLCAPFAFHII